jgi:succinate dehydrogenase / fumarate reductase cytochrome b subunit
MRYRWQTGATAWLLHRITGAAVGVYLLLHILGQFGMKYGGGEGLRDFLTAKPVVIILLAFLIYHALNGVRELIVDFANGALYHKKLFWVMMAIGVVVYLTTLMAL